MPEVPKANITICMGSSCFARGNSRNIEVIQDYLGSHRLPPAVALDRPALPGPLQIGTQRDHQRQDVPRGGPHRHHRPAQPFCAEGEGMNYLNPIYTEKRECQDCYKCVRNCPVKAIKVEGGYASVIPELCILCGQCVEVCPNGAKRVRDDLPQARQLLATKPRVLVSLAPSFVSEFPDVRAGAAHPGAEAAGLFRRLGNGAGRTTGFSPGRGTAAGTARSRAVFVGVPDGGELSAKTPARQRRFHHRPADAAADALQNTAAEFRRGHWHRVHRAMHRQENRSGTASGIARCGANV